MHKLKIFITIIYLFNFSQTAASQCDCNNKVIQNHEQFETFLSEYGDCKSLKGKLKFSGEGQYDISRLKNVKHIDKLYFSNCKQLKNIVFPQKLNSCNDLKIGRCEMLEEIDLRNLTRVIEMELSNLHQLRRLKNNEDLGSMISLKIAHVSSNFEIEHAFNKIAEVYHLIFEGNANEDIWTLPSQLFPNLKKVVTIGFSGFKSLQFQSINKTDEVILFPLLESVGTLHINKIKNIHLLSDKNRSHVNIRFPKLKNVSNLFLIKNGDWLKNLDIFPAKMETKTSIIQDNPALSYCGEQTFLCSILSKLEDPTLARNWLESYISGNKDDSCIASGELYNFCTKQQKEEEIQQLTDVLKEQEFDLSLSSGLRTVPQIGHVTKIKETALSPDGKLLATLSLDGWLKIWDLASHKLIISICNPCYLIGHKKSYCGNPEEIKNKEKYTSYLESLSYPVFSKDSRKISVKGRDQFYIFSLEDGEKLLSTLTQPLKEQISLQNIPLDNFDLEPYASTILDSGHSFYDDGKLIMINEEQTTIINFDFNQKYICKLPLDYPVIYLKEQEVLIGINKYERTKLQAWGFGPRGPILKTEFKGHTKDIINYSLSPDSLFLASGSLDKKVMVWDLQLEEGVQRPIDVFRGHQYPVQLTKFQNGHSIIKSVAIKDDHSQKIDKFTESEEMYWNFYTPEEKDLDMDLAPELCYRDPSREYSENGLNYYCQTGSEYNSHLSPNKKAFTHIDGKGRPLPFGASQELGDFGYKMPTYGWNPSQWVEAEFSPSGNYLISKLFINERGNTSSRVHILESVNTVNKKLYGSFQKKSWKKLQEITGRKFRFSPDDEYLLVQQSSSIIDENGIDRGLPRIKLLKPDGRVLLTLPINYGAFENIHFTDDAKHLVIVESAIITFWSIKENKAVFFMIPDYNTENYALVLANGFYTYRNHPDVIEKIALVNGTRPYSIRQFDCNFHQRDSVIAAVNSYLFGKMSEKTKQEIELSRKVQERRNCQWNEEWLSAGLPTIELKEIAQTIVTNKILSIDLQIKSKKPIYQLQAFINGTPVSKKSFSISEKWDGQLTSSFELELNSGRNKIDFLAFNTDNVESLETGIEIRYDKKIIPDLYFFGFGASDYKNPSLNLANPDKDIRKMQEAFDNQEGTYYRKVHTTTFINENLTVESIKKISEKLETAKVDDVVIIYWAGHGKYLNNNNDLNLFTYSTNPSQLAQTAISFSDLYSQLDKVLARKKLMIINTCESGEPNDNPELFQKMKSLFLDFRRGNGTSVIASSGVNQNSLSYPTDEYTVIGKIVLHSLGNISDYSPQEIDLLDDDSDGYLSVQELFRFLKIAAVSNHFLPEEIGKLANSPSFRQIIRQQGPVPELRLNNVQMNFDIWKY